MTPPTRERRRVPVAGDRMPLASPGMVKAASVISGVSKLFLKGPESKYFIFMGYAISVATSPLCGCSSAIDNKYVNKWDWLCPNKTLFSKTGSQPAGCSLQTSVLHV